MTSTTKVRWWLDAVLSSASSASTMRCSAVSAPMVMSVPNMSLSIDPTIPTRRRCWCAAAASGCSSPASTSSASSSGHSSRKRLAPVRLPSPPITTSASMPRSTRLRAARRRPSRVRKGARPGGSDHRAAALQDAADVRRLEPADQLAALDEPLIALVHRVDVDAVVQRGADDGPHRRVHPTGIPTAGQHRDAGRSRRSLVHPPTPRRAAVAGSEPSSRPIRTPCSVPDPHLRATRRYGARITRAHSSERAALSHARCERKCRSHRSRRAPQDPQRDVGRRHSLAVAAAVERGAALHVTDLGASVRYG